jgi:uncharacterized protein (DUF924 family)
MTPPPAGWAADIARFWFAEIAPELWFKKDEAFDQSLRDRFLAVHEAIAALPAESCLTDAETALSAVIALDQFPRNMFRGTPRAFATDAKAHELAEQAIARGFEVALSKDQRVFLYLPFEHAEDAAAQARCIELMAKLGDPELLKWAEAHKAIIDRFGRFPHRNAVLGRPSTPEEAEFLTQPGSSF